jgi:ABC-type sugar transport system ATPase subunit
VRDPRAFLMDEPLSNLDAKLRVQMRTEISRIQQRLETTTIYVTHDQTEAMTLGDRIAVMRAGILQQVGPPSELYGSPNNLFVAGFIGSPSMNFLAGKVVRASESGIEVELNGGPRTMVRCSPAAKAAGSLEGAPVTLGVRPEILDPAGNGDSRISGKVHNVVRLGGDTFFYLTGPDGTGITVHAPGDMVVAHGDAVTVGFNGDRCHLFGENGEAFRRLQA